MLIFSNSRYLYPLSYVSTVLLIVILSTVGYFAKELYQFEVEVRENMVLFQSFEQAAWKTIIALEKLHTRVRRQKPLSAHRSAPKKPKARKSKLSKNREVSKKLKLPIDKQLVSGANELAEIDEYLKSDMNNSEKKPEKSSENSAEKSTESEEGKENEEPGASNLSESSEDTSLEIIDISLSEGADDASTDSEIKPSRNMSRREMKMENGYTNGGLVQLLEVHNDKSEEDEEDEDAENEEGGEEEAEDEEEQCPDGALTCYGNPCPRGSPGPPGIPGAPGESAPDGIDGNNGTEWELHVEDRVIILGCVKCPPGPRGIEGDPGPPGDKGGVGKNGNPGLDGYEGFPGQTGPEGDAGYDGDYGPDGWSGQRGEDSKIYRNLQGPPGPPGVAGPPGENGDAGNGGSGGVPGIAGVVGPPGEHGIPGPPGTPGMPGEAGLSGISEGHVGQCKCPERRQPIKGGNDGYALPPFSYYSQSPPPLPSQYIRQDQSILKSSEYPTTTGVYRESTTISVYRYFVKAAVPGYLKSQTAEYSENIVTPTPSEYSIEKESVYVDGFRSEVETAAHLAEDFEPPEDHPALKDDNL